jgi:hypothetical protein
MPDPDHLYSSNSSQIDEGIARWGCAPNQHQLDVSHRHDDRSMRPASRISWQYKGVEVLDDNVFIAIINAQASVAPHIRAYECDQVIAQSVSTKTMLHITQFNGLRALAPMGNVILANSKYARMSFVFKDCGVDIGKDVLYRTRPLPLG